MRLFVPLFVLGLAPLLASSSAAAQPAAPLAVAPPLDPLATEPPPPLEVAPRRSRGMMIAGMVLVGLGAAGTVGGTVLGLYPSQCDAYFCGLKRFTQGVGVVVGSGLVGGLGAALWVVGASRPGQAQASGWALPQVAVGPGALRVTWAF